VGCHIETLMDFFLSSLFKLSFHHLRSMYKHYECSIIVLFQTGNKNFNPLSTVPVRSINDLSPGDVIRFRYYGLSHEAVLVRIAEAKDITLNVWNPRSCE
jgi:hypothetical protein